MNDERAALVARLRNADEIVKTFAASPGKSTGALAADLIEADGKRLALAEETILNIRQEFTIPECTLLHQSAPQVRSLLADYDAAKEAL